MLTDTYAALTPGLDDEGDPSAMDLRVDGTVSDLTSEEIAVVGRVLREAWRPLTHECHPRPLRERTRAALFVTTRLAAADPVGGEVVEVVQGGPRVPTVWTFRGLYLILGTRTGTWVTLTKDLLRGDTRHGR